VTDETVEGFVGFVGWSRPRLPLLGALAGITTIAARGSAHKLTGLPSG
jgi:hypothetical protein